MSIDLICGKCGNKIANTKILKSVKDVMNPHHNRCPKCGFTLCVSEFALDMATD